MRNEILDAALKYAEMGFAVFPCSPDKKPATAHGFKNATMDEKQIKHWFSSGQYMIGIACGAISGGLLLIDLDRNHGNSGADGVRVLDEWEKKNGRFPDTVCVNTPSGGVHLWFTGSDEITKNITALYAGVDIKTGGGYLIAPPSHGQSGDYTFADGCGIDDIPVAPIDDNVRNFINSGSKTKRQNSKKKTGSTGATIPEGGRNDALFRRACSLHAQGYSEAAIIAAITAENSEKCKPCLPDKEITALVESALKYDNTKIIPQVNAIRATDLMKLDIPPVSFLIDQILPKGIGVLSAPPKYYKSYMALDACISICNGEAFLDHQSNRSVCLYFDLESTKRRPRDRIKQITESSRKIPHNLYLITFDDTIPKIGAGFEEIFEDEFIQHPDIGFVVIDVFQIIRPKQGRNQLLYDKDYDDIRVLKAIVQSHDAGLLLITHDRKQKDFSDVFNNMSGSTGLLGAADFAWKISKKDRSDNDAVLDITGRDIESFSFRVRFNTTSFRWEYVGTDAEIKHTEERNAFFNSVVIKAIIALVDNNNGRWSGTITDLIDEGFSLGHEINLSAKETGKLISRFESLLDIEKHIGVVKQKRSNRRELIFEKIS